jgi:superfamily II DNA or RNA helicase
MSACPVPVTIGAPQHNGFGPPSVKHGQLCANHMHPRDVQQTTDEPLAAPKLSFFGGTLLLENCPPRAVERVFADLGWLWDARAEAWRIDALRYAAVADRVRHHRLACDDCVPRWTNVRWPANSLPPLRPYQRQAVEAWHGARRGMVIMPTGTGKTEVALAIMAKTAVSTLVVAPVRDLMYQWHRRILGGLGYDAGIIGDSSFQLRPVAVTTYESAYIHMDRLGDRFALIVFDECHHLPGPAWGDAARMSAAPWRLGLTATPERTDGREVELPELIGPVAYEMPLAEARGSTLADYEVVRIGVRLAGDEQARYNRASRYVRRYVFEQRRADPGFSWKDVCTRADSDTAAGRALRAFRAKQAIEDRAAEKLRVLEDLFRLHADEPTIVFAGSNAMARDVSRRFLVPCLLSHCGKRERREILSGFEQGVYPAIVANRVLDEGVDLPEAKVAIVIGGTASTRQARQRLGRVLRKCGHARAVLYEVVCVDTSEEGRSRKRRRNDAYARIRHRRL